MKRSQKLSFIFIAVRGKIFHEKQQKIPAEEHRRRILKDSRWGKGGRNGGGEQLKQQTMNVNIEEER